MKGKKPGFGVLLWLCSFASFRNLSVCKHWQQQEAGQTTTINQSAPAVTKSMFDSDFGVKPESKTGVLDAKLQADQNLRETRPDHDLLFGEKPFLMAKPKQKP